MMKQTFTLLTTLLLSVAAEAQTEPAKAPSSGAAGGKTIVTVSKSTPELPRKSEGDVVELTDGRLLLVSMEFGGDGSDFATTRLVAHESSDGGLTWGGHRVITDTAPNDVNVYSPNLIRAKDGGILLIFHRLHGKVGSGYSYTLHAWKSADEGKTFSPLAEFAARRDFALCNATVKRLASGRLLLPVSPAVPGDHGPWGKYAATVLYSDDDGRTWTEAANRLTLPKRGAMEPHVEQAGDGRVLMVMRNQLGTLHLSESTDDGVHWSEPKSIGLASPESCPELTRIPSTGDLLMIWNHSFDPDFRSHYGKRSPLTAAVSKDHGRTWQHVRDIETDPRRAFSNPGCRFTRDGRAILNYWTCEYLPDWRMQDIIDLRVAVIDTAWFYDEPVGGTAPQDIEWSIVEWIDSLIPAYPGWARWFALAHWTAMAEDSTVDVWPGWRGSARDGWVCLSARKRQFARFASPCPIRATRAPSRSRHEVSARTISKPPGRNCLSRRTHKTRCVSGRYHWPPAAGSSTGWSSTRRCSAPFPWSSRSPGWLRDRWKELNHECAKTSCCKSAAQSGLLLSGVCYLETEKGERTHDDHLIAPLLKLFARSRMEIQVQLDEEQSVAVHEDRSDVMLVDLDRSA